MDEVDNILTLIEEWGELFPGETAHTERELIVAQKQKWREINNALNEMGEKLAEAIDDNAWLTDRVAELEAQL